MILLLSKRTIWYSNSFMEGIRGVSCKAAVHDEPRQAVYDPFCEQMVVTLRRLGDVEKCHGDQRGQVDAQAYNRTYENGAPLFKDTVGKESKGKVGG